MCSEHGLSRLNCECLSRLYTHPCLFEIYNGVKVGFYDRFDPQPVRCRGRNKSSLLPKKKDNVLVHETAEIQTGAKHFRYENLPERCQRYMRACREAHSQFQRVKDVEGERKRPGGLLPRFPGKVVHYSEILKSSF